MTEQVTERTGAEDLEGRPRCLEGRKTDRPCWRVAIERRYSNDVEPTVCVEHQRAYELAVEETTLRSHLDDVGAWIATWDDPREGETRLQYHAFAMRENMVEEFWSLSIRAKAAELKADQGPEDKPLTQEQAEGLAELWLRSSALFHAGQMFQDLQAVPEEAFGELSRWQMAGALDAVLEDANAEKKRYGRELKRS